MDLSRLPVAPSRTAAVGDWLVTPTKARARAYRDAEGKSVVLDNGLIRRTIRLTPNAATVSVGNLMTGDEMLRAVMPEAVVTLDGKEHKVGGLVGQPDLAYLRPDWLEHMTTDPAALKLTGFEIGKTVARFPWKRVRHCQNLPWPPPDVSLKLTFEGEGAAVDVHYELYDGIPVMAKWLVVRNTGKAAVKLDGFVSEQLAMVEADPAVEGQPEWRMPGIHIASDYSFGGGTAESANKVARWVPQPEYTSQINYELKMPAVLECRPPLGPAVTIPPGGLLESFRVFELIYDSTDRERRGLALRRMYRTIAPWTTENPIMLHLTTVDPPKVRAAMDQAAEVGFEMVIFSFWCGLDMEDTSPANRAKFKELVDYGHSKGLEVGGYSLLASRRIDDENDVINPKTGKTGGAIFGNSPCLLSKWGEKYFDTITKFIEATGFDLLEHDGSYPGDPCASTSHPGHKGLEDSQWLQFRKIAGFYEWCRARGVYLNVPDWYFLAGSTKSAMGYRETNWSLPRDRQVILARQNMYDGTWEKTPSMGWMFAPLVEYQGGGAAATIEPLHEHLDTYAAHLANYFGFGVQACYRGPRLYDTPETKAVVKKWVSFFKQHRAILESDVIHLHRADGRDLDYVLHVNPSLDEKGLLMVYNPTSTPLTQTLTIPLYYTGLADKASIIAASGPAHTLHLDREYKVRLRVTVPANGVTWYVVKRTGGVRGRLTPPASQLPAT